MVKSKRARLDLFGASRSRRGALSGVGTFVGRVGKDGFNLPSEVSLPDVSIPRMRPGRVRRYDVQLPDVTVPRFRFGKVERGNILRIGPRRRGGGLGRLFRMAVATVLGLAMAKEMMQPEEQRTWHGAVLGVPYDLRPPTSQRLKDAWWNEHAGLFTPTPWGIGWTVNAWRALVLARQMLVSRIRVPAATSTGERSEQRVGPSAASPAAAAASAEQKRREDVVTRSSIDSFPASDPPAY